MKNYNEMVNDEKAQAIYNKLKDQSLTTLSELLMDLSNDYDTDTVFTVDDWLEEEGTDLRELVKTVQCSKELNINKKYIRESIYYSGYKTANSVLELVDEYEAVDWIANGLDINDPRVKELDNMMQSNQ